MALISDLVLFAALVYFIVRQVTTRRPSRARFYVLPLIALVVAYLELPKPVPADQVWNALISVALSVVFGVAQARFTRLYQSGGIWVMQGDWRYPVSWAVLIALHAVTDAAFQAASSANQHGVPFTPWIVALEVAVAWGTRSLVLHRRYPQLATVLAERAS